MIEKISDNYSICYNEQIGSGYSARVYKGIYHDNISNITQKQSPNPNPNPNPNLNSRETNKVVAIKKIDTFKVLLSVLEQELYIVNLLMANPHENICKYYEIVRGSNCVFIVMEYCENNLTEILIKPLSEEFARNYFKQLVEAFKFLHKFNIIHRDLKPANILLTNNRTKIKIIDFGLSKFDGSMTNTFCGSPYYMAPEVLSQVPYNSKIDIWALGAILYEMLSGNRTFGTLNSVSELVKMIEARNIAPIKQKMTKKCKDLIDRLLEIDVKKRIGWHELYNHTWFQDALEISWEACHTASHKIIDNFINLYPSLPVIHRIKVDKQKNTNDLISDSIDTLQFELEL